MPRVSVLLPTYEPNPVHLREAVLSLQAQDMEDWTLLIHDDCSQADVAAMVQPFLEEDARIRFVRSPKRLGIGGNWNACLLQADAPFVQFLFQDDAWTPGYLRRALTMLDMYPSAGFAATGHAYVFEGKNAPEREHYDKTEEAREAMEHGFHPGRTFLLSWLDRGLHPNAIGEPSFVLLRKSLTDTVGPFAEDMPQFLDVQYWTRCLLESDFCLVQSDGGIFRVHAAGASARNQREGKGLFDRLRTLDMITRRLSGEDRRRARRATVEALAGMIAKYKRRKEAGGTVGDGGGAAKAFALRHPFLTMRALARSMVSGSKQD